jgi:hypothetical protein
MSDDQDSVGQEDRQAAAAEVRLHYQNYLDNIRDQKSRMWSVTYYSLLLYGALVAVLRIYEDNGLLPTYASVAATVLAVLIALAAVTFLFKAHDKLFDYRRNLQRIRNEHFTQTGRRAHGSEDDGSISWFRDAWIPIASVIGAIGVMFLAWELRP